MSTEPIKRIVHNKKSFPEWETAYTKEEIHTIFHRFSLLWPQPKSELNYTNAYTLLIAVVLSAQATDAGVNKATKTLFSMVDTPEKMLQLGELELGNHIRTIGLWRNKSQHIIALSQQLITHYQSKVPDTLNDLMTLAGVGRKTANVILNSVFRQPTMAVDTHIFRIANRIRLAPGKTPNEVEQNLLHIIPKTYLLDAHHWLIFQGRYICKARKPECSRCVIADLCKFPSKTATEPSHCPPILE